MYGERRDPWRRAAEETQLGTNLITVMWASGGSRGASLSLMFIGKLKRRLSTEKQGEEEGKSGGGGGGGAQ